MCLRSLSFLFFAVLGPILQVSAATFTVTTTADAGAGSVRQAILDANASGGSDVIEFNIAPAGEKTITLLNVAGSGPLPVITEILTIDGTTQPGFVNKPIIELNGQNITTGVTGTRDGLRIAASGCVIRGLVINRFRDDGIEISNVGNTAIQNCIIGLDLAGNADLGNSVNGILIINGGGNVIGGSDPGMGNVISGNNQSGVRIEGGSFLGNLIAGNIIGLDRAGTTDRGNGSHGIYILGSANNTIGGGPSTTGARNVISGNDSMGVRIEGAAATGNSVVGNYVGLDVTGAVARGNGVNGIHVVQGSANIIGGSTTEDRNVISANQVGVLIEGVGAEANIIRGNYIGTDAQGMLDLGNTTDGIRINGIANTVIGGDAAAQGNLISGNNSDGIEITGAGAAITTVTGNRIGVTATGTALGNSEQGVLITGNANGTVVGGAGAGSGNTIAFNIQDAVYVASGTNNTIRGNSTFSNGGFGIDLDPNGATVNDAGDIDVGANQKQNFPVLTSAVVNSANTVVKGTLNSAASGTFTLDFYSVAAPDPAGGEGQHYLGSSPVTTDAAGNASFEATLAVSAPARWITATATDSFGNTSEFSGNVRAETTAPGATFTVTTTADSGPGSFRQALLDANAAFALNTIAFNIPGGGPQTNRLQSPLPTITNSIVIDGYTQPGAAVNTDPDAFNGVIHFMVNGMGAAGATAGLNVQWPGVKIKGLGLMGFGVAARAIELGVGSSGAVVEGNLVGVLVTNIASRVNGAAGVFINGSSQHRIGGTTPAARNVISGNGEAGILIDGAGATDNLVLGNLIGTLRDGRNKPVNAQDGIRINGGSRNIIGGSAAGSRNVISGNSGEGVEITGATATGNIVEGNYVGPDVTGFVGLRNTSHGVLINASGNAIGGTTAGKGNLIAFNDQDGIFVSAGTQNALRGNNIHSNNGLGIDLNPNNLTANDPGDVDGGSNLGQNFPVVTAATINVGNTQVSGSFNGAADATFAIDFFSSVIAEATNHGEGQQYLGSTSVATDSSGNATFTVTLPTQGVGKFICATATDSAGNTSEFGPCATATSTVPPTTFTVTTTADSGAGSLRQAILDANQLGTDDIIAFAIPGDGPHVITPATALPVITDGVTIDGYTQAGASPNTDPNGFNATLKIVLSGASQANGVDVLTVQWSGVVIKGLNVISAKADGIEVGQWSNCRVEGCVIGLNLSGADTGNTFAGIHLNGAIDSVVGGDTSAARNVISGNNQGVVLEGTTAFGNRIVGNFIGVGLTPEARVGNSADGVVVTTGAHHTIIGGSTAGARNVISGNGGSGVVISNSNVTNNVVVGNYIGTDATGTVSLNNAVNGVVIASNSINNRVGGSASGEGNRIAFNTRDGVIVTGATSTNNAIRGNTIFSNGELGIDLVDNGATANDALDADSGPNRLQNFPRVTSAVQNVASTEIVGTFNGEANGTFALDFFSNIAADSSGNGEGQQYLGSHSVTTDAEGNASFSITLPISAIGKFICGVATDSLGNSSEFGPCTAATSTAPGATFTVTTTADAGAGSLRQAILDANLLFNSGDTIVFAIPGDGPHTISPVSALPAVTDRVLINGYSQPGASVNTTAGGFNAVLQIILNGSGTPNGVDGLSVQWPGVTIRGLNIHSFKSDGVEVGTLAADFTMEGCVIGLSLAGADLGNNTDGVFINGASNALIGGETSSARNIISGNGRHGVSITGASAVGNRVLGNFIGTDLAGSARVFNNQDGVNISSGAHNTTVGGSTAGARNILSGNNQDGVEIIGVGATNNVVVGNYIGTDVTGVLKVQNNFNGVFLGANSQDNRIGGIGAGEGNRIAFNNGDGIASAGSTNNVIRANSIFNNGDIGIDLANNGLTANDTLDVDTGPNGLQNYPNLTGATATPAGTSIRGTLRSGQNRTYTLDFYSNFAPEPNGPPEGEKYLGSGSVTTDSDGIGTFDVSVTGVVNGRFITATATDAAENTSEFSAAIRTESTIPPPTLLVTTTADAGAGSLRQALLDARNFVSGDPVKIHFNIPGDGPHVIIPATQLPTPAEAVEINGFTQPGASANTLAVGNDSVLKVHLSGDGVSFFPALRMTNAWNVIRGLSITEFSQNGLELIGNSNRVEGCFIGLAPDGTLKANNSVGIYVHPNGNLGGGYNLIGGGAPSARNVISGNLSNAILFENSGTNVVQGNYIGTDPAGLIARGNGSSAVVVSGSTGNLIGGSGVGEGNLISGNSGEGVGITHNGSANTRIFGNKIGVNAAGTGALPNDRGVGISSGSGNVIGGVGAGEGNVIMFNQIYGVVVSGFSSPTNNIIRGNSIYENGSLGIELGFDLVTPNDAHDVDPGPNLYQNYPVINSALATPSNIRIQGVLNSEGDKTYTLDFYASPLTDASGNGEGQQYLGSVNVLTDLLGDGVFDVTLPAVIRGRFISATASHSTSGTSEFSKAFEAATTFPAETFVVTNTNNEGPGSLRQAILDNNLSVGGGNNIIRFDIPGDGPHKISPQTTLLPGITHSVTIDGYTQQGALANTLALGSDAVMKIAIDGANVISGTGLSLNARGCIIRGLSIRGFFTLISLNAPDTQVLGCWLGIAPDGTPVVNQSNGIFISELGTNAMIGGPAPANRNVIAGLNNYGVTMNELSAGARIRGNYFGVIPSGLAALANRFAGVLVVGRDHVIGEPAAGAGNVISAGGVVLFTATNCVVQGNLIGPDATGTHAFQGVSGNGVDIQSSSVGNLIGGGGAGEGNVISGNGNNGISIFGLQIVGNRVSGNYIGTDVTGTIDLGNANLGISMNASTNQIGGATEAEGNAIAFNRFGGITINLGKNIPIRRNRIYAHEFLGIDLDGSGVTPNDADDSDTGANLLQNFPVITAARIDDAAGEASGFLQSAPNQAFELDFFANFAADGSGNGEGQQYLGSTVVNTGGNGRADFVFSFQKVAVGRFITATATDANNNTSEFSAAFRATSTRAPHIFIVTTANDTGAGSLREALSQSVNFQGSGPNKIHFNIPGEAGPVINVLSQLPSPGEPVDIDAFTQPGATVNNQADRDVANRRVELRGSLLSIGEDGLRFTMAGNIVRGLIISDFPAAGIVFNAADNCVVEGSAIISNRFNGIVINNSTGVLVGGSEAQRRNIIFGNNGSGILVTGPSFGEVRTADNRILGNFIGVDANASGQGHRTQSNGVLINNQASRTQVGGTAAAEGNVIASNNRGVTVQNGTQNTIRGNSIFDSANIPIDLGSNGVSANDSLDADTGANLLQNYPSLQTATLTTSGPRVTGLFNSAPNATFKIDFYWNAACDVSTFGEGTRYLGEATVNTDASGNVTINVLLTGSLPRGVVTATATDSAGNTSEFSNCATIGSELPPQTYLVTNVNDSGAGSLRQAILDANNAFTTGANFIHFNIPSPAAGLLTIQLLSPLPDVTAPVTIDGLTQAGTQSNTSVTGINSILRAHINGANAGDPADGLRIRGDGSLVRGMIVTGFKGAGIRVLNASNVTLEENFLGVTSSQLPAPARKRKKSQGGIFLPNTIGMQAEGGVGNLVSGNMIGENPGGGAIFIGGQDLTIQNSIISGNGADTLTGGGGIFARGASGLTLTRSTIAGNSPSGVEIARNGNTANTGTTIDSCSITDNGAPGAPGGGIFVNQSTFTAIQNSTVARNESAGIRSQGPSSGGQQLVAGNDIIENIGPGIALNSNFGMNIGGTTEAQRNTIQGNQEGGINADGNGNPFFNNEFGIFNLPMLVDPNEALVVDAERTVEGGNIIFSTTGRASPGETVTVAFFLPAGAGIPILIPTQTLPVVAGPDGVYQALITFPAGQAPSYVGTITCTRFGDCSQMEFAGPPDGPGNFSTTLTGPGNIQPNTTVQFNITFAYQGSAVNPNAQIFVNVPLPDGFEIAGFPVAQETGGANLNIANTGTGFLMQGYFPSGSSATLPLFVHPTKTDAFHFGVETVVNLGDNSITTDDSPFITGIVVQPVNGADIQLGAVEIEDPFALTGQRVEVKVPVFNGGNQTATGLKLFVDAGPGGVIIPPFNGPPLVTEGAEQFFSFDPVFSGGVRVVVMDVAFGGPGAKTVQFRIQQAESDPNPGNNTGGGSVNISGNVPGPFDFADAPDSYLTLDASGGPRHFYTSNGLRLGATADSETDGMPSANAFGDGLDDDGVIFRSPLVAGLLATVDVTVSRDCLLDLWIDYDGNGVFDMGYRPDGPWEYVAGIIEGHPNPLTGLVPFPLKAGLNRVRFFTPNIHYRSLPSYARFRVSSGGWLSPGGIAFDGEVEDYLVQIFDLSPDMGDAPDSLVTPKYPTLLAHGGAVHISTLAKFHLGQRLDFEPDGLPSPNALGDDEDNGLEFPQSDEPDDEDGVVFPAALTPGSAVTLNVFATIELPGPAKLDAWIDFNQDGDWMDAGEKIFNSVNLIDGNNAFQFTVPANATIGKTFARFRMSRAGNLQPDGVADSGEVEDYEVNIGESLEAPTLRFGIDSEGTVTLFWDGPGRLQSAPDVDGPWGDDVEGNPITKNTRTGSQIFRVRR